MKGQGLHLAQGATKKIIFIVGPTATGKTAVGALVCQRISGEVVSCDSMQVYDGVDVLSNKPSRDERKAAFHHLIGHVPLSEEYDVGRYRQQALRCIDEIFKRGKIPVVVGGTGMYVKVLLDGIFDAGSVPRWNRWLLEFQAQLMGSAFMHRKLQRVDLKAAQKIHPNDLRRIIRGLEVFQATGKPLSQWQDEREGLWGQHDIRVFGLDMDRAALYDRINRRVDDMFDQNAVQEVSYLRDIHWSRTAKSIIGVQEILNYLSGAWPLERAKEEIKKNSRHLAKRQLTWFRAEKRVEWIMVGVEEDASAVAQKIMEKMKGGAC
ncbi:MAG TPA: tRNA (adenosine(37)-N6)-dimethylallyltransferase MiaA [Candidatus Bathyarchaeia archaeon]|nr:tRNA (adenosine(37)-N6)-dimethylallyltransferase MiaA [Candidatus Bathyarchaeia archaeon]